MFFYTNRWFNIIAQLKTNGIFYYCNIASPYVIDENIIKYIDYDLDLRVFPDGAFKVLDRNEYNYHSRIMKYPKEIDKILKQELSKIDELYADSKNGCVFNELMTIILSEDNILLAYRNIK